jgi:hypothetical protein
MRVIYPSSFFLPLVGSELIEPMEGGMAMSNYLRRLYQFNQKKYSRLGLPQSGDELWIKKIQKFCLEFYHGAFIYQREGEMLQFHGHIDRAQSYIIRNLYMRGGKIQDTLYPG